MPAPRPAGRRRRATYGVLTRRPYRRRRGSTDDSDRGVRPRAPRRGRRRRDAPDPDPDPGPRPSGPWLVGPSSRPLRAAPRSVRSRRPVRRARPAGRSSRRRRSRRPPALGPARAPRPRKRRCADDEPLRRGVGPAQGAEPPPCGVVHLHRHQQRRGVGVHRGRSCPGSPTVLEWRGGARGALRRAGRRVRRLARRHPARGVEPAQVRLLCAEGRRLDLRDAHRVSTPLELSIEQLCRVGSPPPQLPLANTSVPHRHAGGLRPPVSPR